MIFTTLGPAVWGSVVVHPTERMAISGDLAGYVNGLDADGDPGNLTTFSRWDAPYPVGSPMFCSPVLAKESTIGPYHVFIGADDGRVHVLRAQEDPGENREVAVLMDNGQPLNGPIRSSMATWNGRLYVLSSGVVDEDGDFTTLPRLYAFGQ